MKAKSKCCNDFVESEGTITLEVNPDANDFVCMGCNNSCEIKDVSDQLYGEKNVYKIVWAGNYQVLSNRKDELGDSIVIHANFKINFSKGTALNSKSNKLYTFSNFMKLSEFMHTHGFWGYKYIPMDLFLSHYETNLISNFYINFSQLVLNNYNTKIYHEYWNQRGVEINGIIFYQCPSFKSNLGFAMKDSDIDGSIDASPYSTNLNISKNKELRDTFFPMALLTIYGKPNAYYKVTCSLELIAKQIHHHINIQEAYTKK